jgi:hypothetical protein
MNDITFKTTRGWREKFCFIMVSRKKFLKKLCFIRVWGAKVVWGFVTDV